MSTTLSNSSDLSTEVAGLKKLVIRLLHLLDQEAGAEQSQTIPEFCRSEKINRAFFYQLQKTGRGPRTMRHADGCIRISPEARTDWRREAEASVEFLSEHNTTPPLKDWPVTGRESGAGRFVLDQRNRRPGAPHDDFIHSISRRSRRRPAWRGQLAVQPAAELHAIDQRKLPDHCIAAARMTPDERQLLTSELSLRLAVAITCALERTRS